MERSSRSPRRRSRSPSPRRLGNINADVQIEIIRRMSLKSIKNLCKTSRQFKALCETNVVKRIMKEKKQLYLYLPKGYPLGESFNKDNVVKSYKIPTYGSVIIYKNISGVPRIPYNGERYIIVSETKPNTRPLQQITEPGHIFKFILWLGKEQGLYNHRRYIYLSEDLPHNFKRVSVSQEIPKYVSKDNDIAYRLE